MQLDVYNYKGIKSAKIEVSADIFDIEPNEAVVHQTLVMQQANKRLGTASTKTRGEVNRSSRKLYAQKHTGRARRGAADSPVLVGGGVAFGPKPRSYHKDMPKKMRRLAIKSVLSDRAASGRLKVIDKFDFDAPRTAELQGILVALGIGSTVLIATVNGQENLIMSAMNLPGVKTVPARLLNVNEMLSCRELLLSEAAVKVVEEVWGKKEQSETAAKAE
ncbi:MAG TPA: 50S ribosomal protein L4 [Dehalococcoidia bacterium]|nr:50S ribosomal protein L4 [Dehalococcoidia bacterium]